MKHIKLFEQFINEFGPLAGSGNIRANDLDKAKREASKKSERGETIYVVGGKHGSYKLSKYYEKGNTFASYYNGMPQELDEAFVNEGMMPISQYYKNSGKSVKTKAKEIDAIINTVEFILPSSKDKLLDLITDLVEEYHLEKSLEADRNLQESVDVDYWADYNTDTSGRGKKEHAEKSTKFNKDFFNKAMNSWNSEADSGSGLRAFSSEYSKIYKMAEEFFKKAGYISTNIIHAMIMQES
jgi:hypothetical protein